MYLEIHDTEVGKSLAARVRNIDYDYQAEIFVAETVKQNSEMPPEVHRLVKWILFDDIGIRCIWERTAEQARRDQMPAITEKSARYQGEYSCVPE